MKQWKESECVSYALFNSVSSLNTQKCEAKKSMGKYRQAHDSEKTRVKILKRTSLPPPPGFAAIFVFYFCGIYLFIFFVEVT